MSTLTAELVGLGFSKKLSFTADSSTKILVISNIEGTNNRYSLTGNLKMPTTKLLAQNPTIKAIQDGVRFHLSKK